MLFYTPSVKVLYLTGGMKACVSKPYLLVNFSEVPKMQFLAGSYYLYTFVILAILIFIMWKIISSPFGLCLKPIRIILKG